MRSRRLFVGQTRRLTIAVIASAALLVSACASGVGTDIEAAPLPGLDSRLDVLLRACESGVIEQCETLYWDVAPDSEYATRALAMIPANRLAAMLERRPGSEGPAPAPGPQTSPPTAAERAGGLQPDGEPYFETLVLTSGFAGDPRLIPVRAGGYADSSFLPVECQGIAIGFRPDVRLIYEAGPSYPLNIYAYSRTDDLAVVVQLPDGRFICNDDYSGLNPAVLIDRPRSGTYNIWVGVYGDDFGDGTLAISELTPNFG
jgi:predicted small secreted protein